VVAPTLVPVKSGDRIKTDRRDALAHGQSFFISVSAQGDGGHESLFAYPEFRCDASGCTTPDGALNIMASK
jgi:hypothetical protein